MFKPMAWTVAFALLGALFFPMLIAPVLSSFLFWKGRAMAQPGHELDYRSYRHAATWAIEHRLVTVGVAVGALLVAGFLGLSGVIGSEFLPHLDEGAIWVRGTLAPSTGPTAGVNTMNRARVILAAFPEVTKVVSQVGRPDDGTDSTGFFNTEYLSICSPRKNGVPPSTRTKRN